MSWLTVEFPRIGYNNNTEFGRFPLIIKQKVQVLKYWQRLLSLPHERVLKQSYNCLKELKELGKCNWCTYVHEITIETGFEGAWESQIRDKKTFGLIKENSSKITWKTV